MKKKKKQRMMMGVYSRTHLFLDSFEAALGRWL